MDLGIVEMGFLFTYFLRRAFVLFKLTIVVSNPQENIFYFILTTDAQKLDSTPLIHLKLNILETVQIPTFR